MSNNAVAVTVAPLKGPHARRRFTQHLVKVQQLLNDAAGNLHPAEMFFQKNARTPMFMLQALGRVYKHLELHDTLFERIRQETKIVEDALGAMDFWNVVTKKCQEWRLPAGIVQLARDHYLESSGRTWAWIESQDWLTCRYHPDAEVLPERFPRKLKKIDWHSPKKEARLLSRWLTEELHDLHENVQHFDLNHIERGLHEARRAVRWVSIYFTAVEGAFVLDGDARVPEKWERYLTKEIVENPFNRLPVPEADDVPIRVPAPLLYALSYAIDRLGVLKDRAQWTETVEGLLVRSGEKLPQPLPAYMKENYLEHGKATRQGQDLIEQVFVKDEVLLRLAEGIKSNV